MLRGETGCPWDREQTHASLRPFLIEETYEVLDALDRNDFESLKEELGDLLLQIVFHSQLALENGRFGIGDVLENINSKLIRRHPHVFGDAEINTSQEQRIHWERLKKQEGKASVLDGVPDALPALLKACRIQQKAATVGFDWENVEQVWEKVDEEYNELKKAVETNDQAKIEEELGDLLFAIVNLSRFIKVNPEDALREGINKFNNRFQQLEKEMTSLGRDMQNATLEEMDIIWNRIKNKSRLHRDT